MAHNTKTELAQLKTIEPRPVYLPDDVQGPSYDENIGYPGEFPFTRGVQPTMYRGRLWTMRQYAGMGDAEESNKRYKYLLAHGTTGLSVAFDLPTQIGMDSDHSMALGEVGKVGVAIAYVEAAIHAGLSVDRFAPRLSFFFNSHNNFLEEIAKFRAARRIWARIMKERFQARNPRSMMLRFHTQTAGSTLTAQQPENNIVRTAVQAMAAVLGGTQSLHTNSFDEALGLPTEEAAKLALRTQQVIAHESGIVDTVDPLAGSYFVESLTDEVEADAWRYLEKIDGMGGAVAAIELGYVQQEIQNAAYDFQQAVDRQENVVVGVNRFQSQGEKAIPIQRIDEALESRQVERLRALRQRRDKR